MDLKRLLHGAWSRQILWRDFSTVGLTKRAKEGHLLKVLFLSCKTVRVSLR